MSDPSPDPACEPTVYGPCGGSYVAVADLVVAGSCSCDGIDVNDEADAALLETMLAHASRRTFTATDGKFTGCCTSTIRPCRRICTPQQANRLRLYPAEWMAYVPAVPMLVSFLPSPTFVNCWACSCNLDPCSCTRLETIRLPWLPVREVTEVKIDGVVLDPTIYRQMPGTNVLARLDGERWPVCQDQSLEDTEAGTWSVTFRHGLDLPPEGKDLVAGFACELAKRCKGAACSLPNGLRVVRRPGVEYAVIDPLDYRKEGLTGYMPLDDWIMQLRGGHARTRPRLWSQFKRPTAMRG